MQAHVHMPSYIVNLLSGFPSEPAGHWMGQSLLVSVLPDEPLPTSVLWKSTKHSGLYRSAQ